MKRAHQGLGVLLLLALLSGCTHDKDECWERLMPSYYALSASLLDRQLSTPAALKLRETLRGQVLRNWDCLHATPGPRPTQVVGDNDDSRPLSLLDIAAVADDAAAVEKLVREGAHRSRVLDRTGSDQMSPFDYAAAFESPKAFRALLANRSNLRELTDEHLKRSLFHASGFTEGGRQVVAQILDQGVPVDSMSGEGVTALMVAVAQNDVGAARSLVGRGANTEVVVPSSGESLRALASRIGSGEMSALFNSEP